MAPLPSNNTGVLYVDYTTCGEQHTLQFRFNTSASFNDSMALADGFLTALTGGLNLVTIDGARVRDAGTNVTYPVTWTGAATYGTTTGPHNESAYYYDFVGRSIDGRRCRVAVFGAGGDHDAADNDYRISASSSTAVAAAIAALESDGNAACSISGNAVNWQQYCNTGVNAYWRNHIR